MEHEIAFTGAGELVENAHKFALACSLA